MTSSSGTEDSTDEEEQNIFTRMLLFSQQKSISCDDDFDILHVNLNLF
jgi:hypothetical protein